MKTNIFWLLFLIPVTVVSRIEAQSPQAPSADAATAQTAVTASGDQASEDPIARLREEGLNRSQVMETLTYLTEVIGPRLTASPSHKLANEWTRDRLAAWGLTNAHLESAGPFGRGWSLKKFSAQIVEPQAIPLAAWPRAWSAGLDWPMVAEVIYLDAKTEAELEKFKNQLKGTVVLIGPPREVKARFEPMATRLTEVDLLKLANAVPTQRDEGARQRRAPNRENRTNSPAPAMSVKAEVTTAPATVLTNTPSNTNQYQVATGAHQAAPPKSKQVGSTELARFAIREGAAVLVNSSYAGDGGTVFSGSATVYAAEPAGTNRPAGTRLSAWSTNAPPGVPQITLATEDYNRLARMLQRGLKLKMAVELQVQFHTNDPLIYNTIAEIPGTDRKREIVMLGAHLDTWQVGTGATDNSAGVAVCMEAVRLLQTLKLQPRRTIRIGLWTGEEQGFLGSKAYVNRHFGYYTNLTNSAITQTQGNSNSRSSSSASTSATQRKLIRQREYDRFSAYFNYDNGGGKIRGIYLQNNEAVGPIFRRWLVPFHDLGAETLTIRNTGGTDHLPFDAVGLPGFQFIQDPLDYNTRTHHSTADVLDRIQPEDLKQSAVIMAAFVYNAAMADEKLPRKLLPTRGGRSGTRP